MKMRWTKDLLLEQLKLGEDSYVEFKEAPFKTHSIDKMSRRTIADELAAFGNSGGGTLIFSVSDAGNVQPLDRSKLDALEAFISEICADSIRPPLPFSTQRLALPAGQVILVEIEQSELVHKSPGGYLHRQGSSKREMSSESLQRLFQRRGRSGLLGPDETIVAGTGPKTLDQALANRFLSSRTAEPVLDQLLKLGLMREDEDGVARATVAGILLGTPDPESYIPGAVIEAVHHRGDVLGQGTQLDAATITGPLDHQIRNAVHFARRNTWIAALKAPGRVEMSQFSDRAIFEAIVNAVVHRDYTIEGSKIRLFIFDDRLDLYSPGSLPNTLPIEAMRNRQATRNQTLASMLRKLEIGDAVGGGDRQYFLELRGEGVPIIYEQTKGLTGHDPEYKLLNGVELLLTIPAASPPKEGIEGEVFVHKTGGPVVGATVVAIFPNKTWKEGETNTFGRVRFDFYSDLPITVFCAAPGYAARAITDWRPPKPLSVGLDELPGGGSAVFTEGFGYLPRLAGRLNPILDNLDRLYLYTTNVAIDEGKQQPVYFKLGQPLLLTDVNGSQWKVGFVEMIGNTALLEYRRPDSDPRRRADEAQRDHGIGNW